MKTLTETAVDCFALGEKSAGAEGRIFVCEVMRNILAVQDVSQIHSYCRDMIELNDIDKQTELMTQEDIIYRRQEALNKHRMTAFIDQRRQASSDVCP